MQNIFAIIVTLVLLAAGAALTWFLRRKGKEGAAAKVRAVLDFKALEELISEALPWLVTQAEKLLGGGTGEIKRAWVVQEVMRLLPEGLRARLDLEHLDPLVDGVLEKLRPLWEDRPEIVDQDMDQGIHFDRVEDFVAFVKEATPKVLMPDEAETPEDASSVAEADGK